MNIAATYPTQHIPPKTLYYRVIGQSVLLLELDRGQISAISAVPEKPEGAAILLLSRDTLKVYDQIWNDAQKIDETHGIKHTEFQRFTLHAPSAMAIFGNALIGALCDLTPYFGRDARRPVIIVSISAFLP